MRLAYSEAAFVRRFDRSKFNESRAVNRPHIKIGGAGRAFGSCGAAYLRRLALNKFQDACEKFL